MAIMRIIKYILFLMKTNSNNHQNTGSNPQFDEKAKMYYYINSIEKLSNSNFKTTI